MDRVSKNLADGKAFEMQNVGGNNNRAFVAVHPAGGGDSNAGEIHILFASDAAELFRRLGETLGVANAPIGGHGFEADLFDKLQTVIEQGKEGFGAANINPDCAAVPHVC
jgi:hypothetical protein